VARVRQGSFAFKKLDMTKLVMKPLRIVDSMLWLLYALLSDLSSPFCCTLEPISMHMNQHQPEGLFSVAPRPDVKLPIKTTTCKSRMAKKQVKTRSR